MKRWKMHHFVMVNKLTRHTQTSRLILSRLKASVMSPHFKPYPVLFTQKNSLISEEQHHCTSTSIQLWNTLEFESDNSSEIMEYINTFNQTFSGLNGKYISDLMSVMTFTCLADVINLNLCTVLAKVVQQRMDLFFFLSDVSVLHESQSIKAMIVFWLQILAVHLTSLTRQMRCWTEIVVQWNTITKLCNTLRNWP